MKNRIDITFVLGVFTSAVVVWIYLYDTIVDLTTADPAAISLLYLGMSHYFSFLSVLFSFILLVRHCLEISLEPYEIKRLRRFDKVADFSQKTLFSVWAPMFVFCVTALLTQNIFSGSRFDFLQEHGGLILGAILCILFFLLILRINIFIFLIKAGWKSIGFSFILFFAYITLLSLFSADVVYKVEKDFYHKTEIARFEVKRKGYILLPSVKNVLYNFHDTLKENSSDVYFADLSKDSITMMSLVEVTFLPQVFDLPMKKYLHINKTEK